MPLDDTTYKTKHDVHSIEALIAWLRTKPSDSTYHYGDTGYRGIGCLLCQYYRESGVKVRSVGVYSYTSPDGCPILLPPGFNMISDGKPRTFGGALERALAYQDQE